jgi:hypothetical protein
MAVLQSQLDALNVAIADGVRQVTMPGGQVTIYNTTASLIQARDDLQRQFNKEQAALAGVRKNRRTLLNYAGRGYQE